MTDVFVEKLVKKKQDGRDQIKKIPGIILLLCSIRLLFFSPFGLLLVLLSGLLNLLVFRSCDVEYEYQYMNGYFDVDKIYHKERRKHVFSATPEQLQVLAPEGSGHLKGYAGAKVYDFTGGYGGETVYGMIYSKDGQLSKILFEPGERMLQGIAAQMPGKTFLS